MNIKKICALLAALNLLFASSFCIDAYAAPFSKTAGISNASSPAIATPFKSNIGWRYKISNGILYKRQYDYTLKRWIGEWIRA